MASQGYPHGSPELKVRNTFLTVEDSGSLDRKPRRLNSFPASQTFVSDTPQDDLGGAKSQPASSFGARSATILSSSISCPVGSQTSCVHPTASLGKGAFVSPGQSPVSSLGPTFYSSAATASIGRNAFLSPGQSPVSSLGPILANSSPVLYPTATGSLRAPVEGSILHDLSRAVRSIAVRNAPVGADTDDNNEEEARPVTFIRKPKSSVRATSCGPISPVQSIGPLASPVQSFGPLASPVQSIGATGFAPTPYTSFGPTLFPPTPMTSFGTSMFDTQNSSNGPEPLSPGASSRPLAVSGGSLHVSSKDARSAPMVVKNTFITIENFEDTLGSRLEQRRKTVPAITPVLDDSDDTRHMTQAATSFPISQFRQMSPTASQPPQMMCAVPQKLSSPQNQNMTQFMGFQQQFSPTQSMSQFVRTIPLGQPIPSPVASPPGVFVSGGMFMANSACPTQGSDQAAVRTGTSVVDGRKLLGQIWALSQDAQGCRQVQDALENSTDDVRLAIAAELHGHVQEALQSPHANFVVRKCVEKVPSSGVQFVVDELLVNGPSGIVEAARHRYGCRIIESLLASCPKYVLPPVIGPLLEDRSSLCGHMYGNFVMQKILEYGTDEQKRVVLDVLHRDVLNLGSNFYGSAVYGTAFKTTSPDDRIRLARTLISNMSTLTAMARFKHGPEIIELCLYHVDETSRQAIRNQLAIAHMQRQQAAASSQPKAARVVNEKKNQKSHNYSGNQARSGRNQKASKS